jgi:hypothetical protein
MAPGERLLVCATFMIVSKMMLVIAGPPSSPITKSISLDLERRGFIVYVVVNSVEEEQIVQGEARVDIRPLHLDIVDVSILFS